MGDRHNGQEMVGNPQMILEWMQILHQPVLEGMAFLTKSLPSFLLLPCGSVEDLISSVSFIFFFPHILDLRDLTENVVNSKF